jgi:EAL domain-containing protein (putative c-di-GMP-specific phosphodiesterase class I)
LGTIVDVEEIPGHAHAPYRARARLASDEDHRSIAAAVISLGQRLNMKVIAEGVETDAQLAILRDSQCDEI